MSTRRGACCANWGMAMANLLVAYRYSEYTTANYLVSAFRALGREVVCMGPGHVNTRPDDWRSDIVIWVEAGGGPPDWLCGGAAPADIPWAGWFIDSHSHAWHPKWAERFDHIFVAQHAHLSRFDADAVWLPVACDPEIHTPPAGIEPEHDVVFVGHLYPGSPLYERRRRLLDMLGERYNLGIYEGAYLKDMAIAHAKGRVVFNVSTSGDLNMRVFEALCSGRPLVTDDVPEAGLRELFLPGRDLFVYTTESDLYSAIDWLLAGGPTDPTARQGRAEVLARHTYQHRAQQMLEVMGL